MEIKTEVNLTKEDLEKILAAQLGAKIISIQYYAEKIPSPMLSLQTELKSIKIIIE